ncbi:MAG: hypothetical protein RLZ18_1191 [Actinomycetota bacterium]
MEACPRHHCGTAQNLTGHGHSVVEDWAPAQARQDAGHEVIRRVVGASAVVALAVTSLAACGSSSKTDYSAFCKLATDMQTASSGDSHGQDPAAITDPKKMEEAWTTITDIAVKMRDGSPVDVKADVTLMVNSIVAMNKVFKDNKYDLLAMSKKPKVREQLAAISGDTKVASASTRFNKFMTKNCQSTN